MTEIAFLVKPDSEMYRKYFKQKNELDKFVGFASSFIDKYFVSRNKDFDYSFSTNMRLTVKLPPNDEEWFGAQLMKEKSESGLCVFKKNSPMNKRWHEEVTSHIDPYSLTASKWWFMDFPYCGKCQIAMWDDGCGNVYGYYSTPAAHHNSGKLPDYVQPIKMSEYYIAQERCKELDSLLSEAVGDEKTKQWLEYNLSLIPKTIEQSRAYVAARGAKILSYSITINGYDSMSSVMCTQDEVDPGTEKARKELEERLEKRKAEKKETEERLEKQRAEKQEQEERQYNLKIDGKDVDDLTGKMVELLGTSTSIGVTENGVSAFDALA